MVDELLCVRVLDDKLDINGREVPLPAALTAGALAEELHAWLAPHDRSLPLQERQNLRAALSPDFMRSFGRKLFDALFPPGPALDAYRASGTAPIALSLPGDLRPLPWELMNDGSFWVGQDRGVVRLIEEGEPPAARDHAGPLRVLALLAMPVLNPMLLASDPHQPYVGDVEKHAAIFGQLGGKDYPAAFRVVRHATPDDLRLGLEQGADVLYFLGHGNADGVCFDDGRGRLRQLDRHVLRQRLHGSGVVVAVTNSCLTASAAESQAPVAAMLVQAGVPVVVGMQVPITDAAAHKFAEAFFSSLARGASPLSAVASARAALQDEYETAVSTKRPREVQAWEWATPAIWVSAQGQAAAVTAVCEIGSGAAVVSDQTTERLGQAGLLPQRPAEFFGRREELVAIADSLEHTPVTVLYGMRGVGKTTLALEAVHRAARRFDRIIWIRARVTMPGDALIGASADPMPTGRIADPLELLNRVATTLELSPSLAGEPLLAAIRAKAAERTTLLVLDNLDSFALTGEFAQSTVLRDLLGALSQSTRVLITVAGDLAAAGRRVFVQGLPPDVAFLLTREYAREMGVLLHDDEVRVIAVSTGGHPMAVRFAVGLIAASPVPRDQIIDGLRGSTGRTMEEVLGYVMGQAVEQASEDARLLFKLASEFPSPLPAEALEAGTLWNDHDRFQKALDEAVKLILLEWIRESGLVLIQELPRARARALDFGLPAGPAHGKAMVDWADRQGNESLFCDLVSAWETYCSGRGHLAEWEQAGREALRRAQKLGDPLRECIARNDLGTWSGRTGSLAEGLKHFRRCKQVARKVGALSMEGTVVGNMGLIYARQGDLARALECHQKAYDIGERLGNPEVVASALGNMGLIYARQGELARALECHQKAYDIGERLGSPELMATVLGNTGNIYIRQGDLDRALECHQRAYEIDVRLGNPQGQATALGNMGVIYADQGDVDHALECHQKAYEIAERLGNPQTMAIQLGSMGNIHRRHGDLARALDCYHKAYDIGEQLGIPELMANALGSIGLICLRQGNLAKARELLERARDLYQRIGIKGQGPEVVARALAALQEEAPGGE
jgi:tetratricopeptide (TPR) repeat protein